MQEYVYIDGKKYKRGYTTGSCAAAASKASVYMLLTNKKIENINIDQISNINLDDVIGATGTHESVHALDKYSNHVGQPDKSKREQNPILKEIEYIKKIKH